MGKAHISAITLALLSFSPRLFAATDTIPEHNLDEIIVTATGAGPTLSPPEMGRHVIDRESIVKLPVLFGEPDIVKSLQTLPGVSQGVEGFTGLYVHGGDNDQNLFLYNGLPLYHVSHLGGIFSSFNVSTIRNIDFFKSAFPARYGGRISSITNINMAKPDFQRYTGKFTVGLLAVNGYISGPIIKDKLAFSAAVRRSWIDVVGVPALLVVNAIQKKNGKKTIADYYFMDFNARVDWKFTGGSLYAIGYYGKDYLKIGNREFESSANSYVVGANGVINSAGSWESGFFDEDRNSLSWGNWGVSLNSDYNVWDGTLNAIAYVSRYFSHYSQSNEHQTNLSDPSTYGYNLNGTRNSISDVGLNLQYMRQFADLYLMKVGGGYVHHNYHPEGLTNEYVDADNSWIDNNDNPLVRGNEVFAYLDNLFNFGENVSLDAGGRFVSHFIQGESFPRFEPRASLRVNVSENYSVKASYARINQFVQQVSSNYISLPTDLWQPIGKGMKPLESDQYSFGVYGNVTKQIYFSLEGWYKDMRNLVEYREGVSTFNPNLAWSEKTTSGKGWAYGVDLSVKREVGKLRGSVGYGLMWNWRKFDELNGGVKFPAKFDNRHKININLTYSLNDKIEFNAGWLYMTGNRITLSLYNYDEIGNLFPDAPTTGIGDSGFDWQQASGIGYYSGRNNIRMPAYHRLDIGMSLFKKLKNGRRSIWNFSLYNAYCRMNTMTLHKDDYVDSTQKNRTFQKFSLIPVVPSVSYTYEF
jgi:hypothetical protein